MSREAPDGSRRGLLEKLLAAVRPEFRADILFFEPGDPVFGMSVCLAGDCTRTARRRGMCDRHFTRWDKAGRPPLEGFRPGGPPHGHAPLPSGTCRAPGCGFGVNLHGLCPRHYFRWRRAGKPEPGPWAAGQPASEQDPVPADCLIGYCRIWAHPGSPLCWVHRRRWKEHGRPDMTGFVRKYEQPRDRESVSLAGLPRQAKLEMQYAIQRRRDDNTASVRVRQLRAVTGILAGSGVSSLLALSEPEWRQFIPEGRFPAARPRGDQAVSFLFYARRQAAALAEGPATWESEYPRDTWRLRRLGIAGSTANLRFGGISQPWLKDLAKRWTRWRISAGRATGTCYQGVRAIDRFSGFLAAAGVTEPGQVGREVLERYLADLPLLVRAPKTRAEKIGQLSTFLAESRQHCWEPAFPADARFFPEDYPKQGDKLPRALAGHVMAQVEDPSNLDRWRNPAYRLITVILIRCGLRISSVVTLAWDCVETGDDGAPFLRYWNTKMKREALVPADEEITAMIAAQHDRVRLRWPGGSPVLFPRPNSNIDGTRPVAAGTYRDALDQWLEDCDIRSENGSPVHLTPHQWRHTLGTVLINRDVPQHVVQKILDHDSPQMTAHYARLSDKTVREHWERARKVNAEGRPVQVSPDGPLGDAAWARQQLSRATQALPNGYCQLPLVKTCPHANSCLTCPMFLTTAEFLPQHHAQREATLQIISAAEAAGHDRVAEMNRQVAGNLDKIIGSLEDEGTGGQEAAAGAS